MIEATGLFASLIHDAHSSHRSGARVVEYGGGHWRICGDWGFNVPAEGKKRLCHQSCLSDMALPFSRPGSQSSRMGGIGRCGLPTLVVFQGYVAAKAGRGHDRCWH